MIAFNQESAANSDATGGNYSSQVDVMKIKDAKWIEPKEGSGSSARAIELTTENKGGQEFRYLSMYYTKRDGSQNDAGMKQIQAMMGLLGIQNLSNNNGQVTELVGKFLKLALERENGKKPNGEDKFNFNIRAAFDAKSGQTYPEKQANKEPESIAYWTKRFADQPNGVEAKGQARAPQGGQNFGAPQAPQGAHDFDDSIPF